VFGGIHRLDRLVYVDLGIGQAAPVFVSEDIHQNVTPKATMSKLVLIFFTL
jgi:hypothetical protein